MLKSTLIALSGALAMLLLLMARSCLPASDLFSSDAYWSCDQARNDDFFRRGWMPDALPALCGPVAGAADLDTNAICSSATFGPKESDVVENALRQLGFSEYAGALDDLPFRSRCPFSMNDVPSGGRRFRRELRGDKGPEFAVVSNAGRLFFWSR